VVWGFSSVHCVNIWRAKARNADPRSSPLIRLAVINADKRSTIRFMLSRLFEADALADP